MTLTQRLLVPGLVIGALARIWLLPVPGSPDMGSWKIWTFVGASDPTGLYGVGGSPPERRLLVWGAEKGTTEYPPLALYQMSAVGWIYKHIDPRYADSPALNALVKTPACSPRSRSFKSDLPRIAVAATGSRSASRIRRRSSTAPASILAQMAVPAALRRAPSPEARAGRRFAAPVLTKAQGPRGPPLRSRPGFGERRQARNAWRRGRRIAALAILLLIVTRGAVPNMPRRSTPVAHDAVRNVPSG